MTQGSIRLVLKPPINDQPFMDLAWDELWLLVRIIHADPEQMVPYELVNQTEDYSTVIHYIEDPVAACAFVHIEGQQRQQVAQLVQGTMATFSEQEILDGWDQATDETTADQAIRRLGVGAPATYHAAFAQRLQSALAHPSARVRHAGLVGIGYRGWPESRPWVHIATEDPDGHVQAAAKAMLEVWPAFRCAPAPQPFQKE